jgi:hypothetical protein
MPRPEYAITDPHEVLLKEDAREPNFRKPKTMVIVMILQISQITQRWKHPNIEGRVPRKYTEICSRLLV